LIALAAFGGQDVVIARQQAVKVFVSAASNRHFDAANRARSVQLSPSRSRA
jgi:hypothetical protein